MRRALREPKGRRDLRSRDLLGAGEQGQNCPSPGIQSAQTLRHGNLPFPGLLQSQGLDCRENTGQGPDEVLQPGREIRL